MDALNFRRMLRRRLMGFWRVVLCGLKEEKERGIVKRKINYFEGWYFKSQSKKLTAAFIPAVSYDSHGRPSGSLQIVFPDTAYCIEYDQPVNMSSGSDVFVTLGKNVFSNDYLHLDICKDNLKLTGDLYSQGEKGAVFNVMGPLSVVPMECKHRILSMETMLSGGLRINGEEFSFDGGKGYLEMDYGFSFPERYLWSQCNWFAEADCRITCAVATLPFGTFRPRGCFACIDYGGRRYKLASYTGAKADLISADGFRIRQGGLVIEGRRSGGTAVELKSPQAALMSGRTDEYLICGMEYRLEDRGKEVFSLRSEKGSFEFF